ncbi:cAMP-specific 3',5'-cyclic phosphodiesterase 4B-like [Scleropages formosus]|uniref:cAMP-specific 3',5'-cyclic phosphodiesterase 4B-like n=1 Tax=Scleropages formosus TaxID=113540 RepID=UPI0008781AB2|nr:cAMP-specific 3',5'-cyclic phosphodiesterase 4B-like [Scleropages formosus]XP_029113077.1 cAMP-specific 3',5'-cyclic phosphodiesterase 4B-like [Scleropages formosus]XP_029113078.1 cAMP-specific 3',5'-cyclic phosphodiesterase 4B-like [Scleropages formosus]XP_029113079.1 cAMP-specific 3',5'-cyclic phosphodiesterase 4B-like [Scleropages formosus]XP_029113080.1 cAMP-specific 3',5'-cyclic phosphodiesterase 4B-like [Scleropages formosus]XP_029113081.1 cAMP-specific 3',5'-cyclic phosphodiesterase 
MCPRTFPAHFLTSRMRWSSCPPTRRSRTQQHVRPVELGFCPKTPGQLCLYLGSKPSMKMFAQELENLDKCNFNIFIVAQLSCNRPLGCIMFAIFQERDLMKTFRMPEDTLMAYVMTVEDHYNASVSYHNSLRRADVTQSTHVLRSRPALKLPFMMWITLESLSSSSSTLVLRIIVHCADLSNPMKPLAVYHQCTEHIMEKFFRRGQGARTRHGDQYCV